MANPSARKSEFAPWKPPTWEIEEAGALQALYRGEAQAHQQKMALQFIIEKLCGTYEFHYHTGSERDTSFALGRAFPGQQIVKLLKINLSVLRRRDHG